MLCHNTEKVPQAQNVNFQLTYLFYAVFHGLPLTPHDGQHNARPFLKV